MHVDLLRVDLNMPIQAPVAARARRRRGRARRQGGRRARAGHARGHRRGAADRDPRVHRARRLGDGDQRHRTLAAVTAPERRHAPRRPDETVIATLTPAARRGEPEDELETETELVGEDGEPRPRRPRARPATTPATATTPTASSRRTVRAPLRRRRRRPTGWSSGSATPARATRARRTTSASRSPSELARRWDLPRRRRSSTALFTEGRTRPGGPRVAVLLPQTYMNDAGRSVGPGARRAARSTSTTCSSSTTRSTCRSATSARALGGGLAGHNGLKSLKAGLGSPDFAPRARRRRAARTRPTPRSSSAYVLGRWRQSRGRGRDLVDAAADAAERLVAGELELLRADATRSCVRLYVHGNVRTRLRTPGGLRRGREPVQALGLELLARLPLEGDEAVSTPAAVRAPSPRRSWSACPRGGWSRADASPAMIERAREELGEQPASSSCSPTSSSSSWTSPWTRCSRARSSTGSPTTTRSFARLHAALRTPGGARRPVRGGGNVADVRGALACRAEAPFAEYLAGCRAVELRPPRRRASAWSARDSSRQRDAPLEVVPPGDRRPPAMRHDDLGAHLDRLPPRAGTTRSSRGRGGDGDPRVIAATCADHERCRARRRVSAAQAGRTASGWRASTARSTTSSASARCRPSGRRSLGDLQLVPEGGDRGLRRDQRRPCARSRATRPASASTPS